MKYTSQNINVSENGMNYPKKENVPSEKNYIEFLYDSHHSVHAITFGQDREKLSNIDGNNRINAICHFLKEPFVLFPERLIPLKNMISEKKDIVVATKVEDIFKKITYDELMNFKYNKFFITKGHGEFYKEHLKDLFDDIEFTIDELIQQMKINDGRFDSDVEININIFSGYTTEELSEVFSKINKYNSGLSEQETTNLIYNSEAFELFCSENEEQLIQCFLEKIF
jgi:NTP pyrophosphatase (non-canonical NTP hydrolase)